MAPPPLSLSLPVYLVVVRVGGWGAAPAIQAVEELVGGLSKPPPIGSRCPPSRDALIRQRCPSTNPRPRHGSPRNPRRTNTCSWQTGTYRRDGSPSPPQVAVQREKPRLMSEMQPHVAYKFRPEPSNRDLRARYDSISPGSSDSATNTCSSGPGSRAVSVDLWTGGPVEGGGAAESFGWSRSGSSREPDHKLQPHLDGWGCAPPAHTADYEDECRRETAREGNRAAIRSRGRDGRLTRAASIYMNGIFLFPRTFCPYSRTQAISVSDNGPWSRQARFSSNCARSLGPVRATWTWGDESTKR